MAPSAANDSFKPGAVVAIKLSDAKQVMGRDAFTTKYGTLTNVSCISWWLIKSGRGRSWMVSLNVAVEYRFGKSKLEVCVDAVDVPGGEEEHAIEVGIL